MQSQPQQSSHETSSIASSMTTTTTPATTIGGSTESFQGTHPNRIHTSNGGTNTMNLDSQSSLSVGFGAGVTAGTANTTNINPTLSCSIPPQSQLQSQIFCASSHPLSMYNGNPEGHTTVSDITSSKKGNTNTINCSIGNAQAALYLNAIQAQNNNLNPNDSLTHIPSSTDESSNNELKCQGFQDQNIPGSCSVQQQQENQSTLYMNALEAKGFTDTNTASKLQNLPNITTNSMVQSSNNINSHLNITMNDAFPGSGTNSVSSSTIPASTVSQPSWVSNCISGSGTGSVAMGGQVASDLPVALNGVNGTSLAAIHLQKIQQGKLEQQHGTGAMNFRIPTNNSMNSLLNQSNPNLVSNLNGSSVGRSGIANWNAMSASANTPIHSWRLGQLSQLQQQQLADSSRRSSVNSIHNKNASGLLGAGVSGTSLNSGTEIPKLYMQKQLQDIEAKIQHHEKIQSFNNLLNSQNSLRSMENMQSLNQQRLPVAGANETFNLSTPSIATGMNPLQNPFLNLVNASSNSNANTTSVNSLAHISNASSVATANLSNEGITNTPTVSNIVSNTMSTSLANQNSLEQQQTGIFSTTSAQKSIQKEQHPELKLRLNYLQGVSANITNATPTSLTSSDTSQIEKGKNQKLVTANGNLLQELLKKQQQKQLQGQVPFSSVATPCSDGNKVEIDPMKNSQQDARKIQLFQHQNHNRSSPPGSSTIKSPNTTSNDWETNHLNKRNIGESGGQLFQNNHIVTEPCIPEKQVTSSNPTVALIERSLSNGRWQNVERDRPDRQKLSLSMINLLETMCGNTEEEKQTKIPQLLCKHLEEQLYKKARTKAEYMDISTLKRRIQIHAIDLDTSKILKRLSTARSIRGNSNTTNVSSTTKTKTDEPKKEQNVKVEEIDITNLVQSQCDKPGDSSNEAYSSAPTVENVTSNTCIPVPTGSMNDSNSDTKKMEQKRHKRVILQQQYRLLLLRHASKCTNSDTCSEKKYCKQMKILWNHMKTCTDKDCRMNKCLSSRCVLNHYRICKSKNQTAKCEVCGPVMRKIQVLETDEVQDSNASHDKNSSNGALLSGNILGGTTNITMQSSIATLQQNPIIAGGNRNLSELSTDRIMNSNLQSTNLVQPNIQQIQLMQQQLQLQQLQQLQLLQSQQNDSNTLEGNQLQQIVLQQLLDQAQTLLKEQQSQNIKNEKGKPSSASSFSLHIQEQQETDVTSSLDEDELKNGEDFNVGAGALDGSTSPIVLKAFDNDDLLGLSTENVQQKKPLAVSTSERLGEKRLRKCIENRDQTSKKTLKIIDGEGSKSDFTRNCLKIVKMILDTNEGWIFKDPVDPIELNLPDYNEIISEPMHLGLVKQRLDDGYYETIDSFAREIRLVFSNAILYNGKDSEVGEMAITLSKLFEEQFKKIQESHEMTNSVFEHFTS